MNCSTLTIGITTFNRRGILQTVAQSLGRVRGLERARVWVLDDCSDEYDLSFLQRLFPYAEVARAPTRSGGADEAMHRLFEAFLLDSGDYLLNMDADLLASPALVDRCVQIIAAHQSCGEPALFSLFNTASHLPIGEDGDYVRKRSVGAAGTLWQRNLLSDVVRSVPVSKKFDWDWSAYLTAKGIPIRVTPRSYLQHIGRFGQHSRSLAGMDHGVDFEGYDGHNLASFLDCTREGLLQMLIEQRSRMDRQAEALTQLTQVVQSQAVIIKELVRDTAPGKV